jgi:alcohol dehydrogenase (cytochrome c)
MWGNYLYFVTPDDYLDLRRCAQPARSAGIASSARSASILLDDGAVVIGNHVLVGRATTSIRLRGSSRSIPRAGRRSGMVRHTARTRRPGSRNVEEPRCRTARRADTHGCPVSTIPRHLYIFGTGNPTPAYTSQTRGEGDNLFTCALVAVNVDTGKMAWYYQTSPHDTHDWDSAQTPVLVDMMSTACAAAGAHCAAATASTSRRPRHGSACRHAKVFRHGELGARLNESGSRFAIPPRTTTSRARSSRAQPGCDELAAARLQPRHGLFYCRLPTPTRCTYLTELDPRGAMGLGGKDERNVGTVGSYLMAIDPKTGKIAWKHKYRTVADGRGQGLLTTAGSCSSAAIRMATSSPTIRRTASAVACLDRPGEQTRPKPTWWMAVSTCSSPRATRCTHSR